MIAGAPPRRTVVALGEPPAWVRPANDAWELVVAERVDDVARLQPSVVHAPLAAARRIKELRRSLGGARIVLDATGADERGRLDLDGAATAVDAIVVGTTHTYERIRSRYPQLVERTTVLNPPLDQGPWRPLAELVESHEGSRMVKRLRRQHRLAGPVVLFLGGYTPAGGLERVVEAVSDVHERRQELRIAALPLGKIDRGYLDRCERRALGLGHHGVVEWTLDRDELPAWVALASVVCCLEPGPVARWAAAAARPFVGMRAASSDAVVVDGETGFLLDRGDRDELVRVLEPLVADEATADAIGAAARARVDGEFSTAAAARCLHAVWEGSPA